MIATLNHTLELDGPGLSVDVALTFDIQPGEKRTQDNPGSADTARLTACYVESITSETTEVDRSDSPELFAWLDLLLFDHVLDPSDLEILYFQQRG
ncbi:MAG: hypothetical protein ACYTBZ_26395 [Planctomycetota bacterium]|jgi:hypothetical protein